MRKSKLLFPFCALQYLPYHCESRPASNSHNYSQKTLASATR
jgi:hypothetical protein